MIACRDCRRDRTADPDGPCSGCGSRSVTVTTASSRTGSGRLVAVGTEACGRCGDAHTVYATTDGRP